jgi:N-acetylmuramoyl-L-alanine amidase-like protein
VAYPFVQAAHDYGVRQGPAMAFVVHMAEGGGTVGFLSRPNDRGVSVHYVIEKTNGRIVQMLLESHASGSINPNDLRTGDDPAVYGATVRKAVMGAWDHDPNAAVISVELEGFAAAGPNAAQHASLRTLVADVRSRNPRMGLLGHRDFQDYKACPGRLIHWDELGGHGEASMIPAPITDVTPKMITTAAGTTFYDLDGKTVLMPGAGHGALPPTLSPYGVGSKRAIYATLSGVKRAVLVTPATVTPLPAPSHTVTLSVDGTEKAKVTV